MLTLTVGSRVLDVPDERAWAFAGGAYYEHNVDAWLQALLTRLGSPVVYDVGANIGYYSLRAAAVASRVYAFEPVSSSFEVLRRNVAGAPVVPLRLGASDRRGEQEIRLSTSSGSNSLYGDGPHATVGVETVPLARIDDLVAEGRLEPPDLVKLDIEGGELAALHGAREVLRERMPCVVMEVCDEICRRAGHTAADLVAELVVLGYRIWGLSDRGGDLTAHPLETFAAHPIGNIVALRPGAELPSDEEVRRALAERPTLDAGQRFQALFARSYRAPRPAGEVAPAAAAVLAELAERRGHVDLIAAQAGTGPLIAALRPHVRGIVAVEPDEGARARTARRFAADPGVEVRCGDVLGELLASAPRPPLVWAEDPAQVADVSAPPGTTLVLPGGRVVEL